ncbi:MAG: hypothetical protein HOP11_14330, partial [Saprospiraceae bacterium]|nr:hypothetical protein [Saprospiraceae bacterium]
MSTAKKDPEIEKMLIKIPVPKSNIGFSQKVIDKIYNIFHPENPKLKHNLEYQHISLTQSVMSFNSELLTEQGSMIESQKLLIKSLMEQLNKREEEVKELLNVIDRERIIYGEFSFKYDHLNSELQKYTNINKEPKPKPKKPAGSNLLKPKKTTVKTLKKSDFKFGVKKDWKEGDICVSICSSTINCHITRVV